MFHPTKVSTWVKAKLSPRVRINNEADPKEIERLLWSEVEIPLRKYLKALVEELLKAEIERHLQALPYERSDERKDWRNNSYERILATPYGAIPDLRVPRTCNGSHDTKLARNAYSPV